jgi:hypothetical protein
VEPTGPRCCGASFVTRTFKLFAQASLQKNGRTSSPYESN